MSSECYYKWCDKHSKNEPICMLARCVKSDKEREIYRSLRNRQMGNANPVKIGK